MRLHTHAQFTLVRGALENSSRAVWLLEPDDHRERVRRRLRQARAETTDLDQVRKLADQPAPRSKTERLAEIADLAGSANVDPREIPDRPGYATMVEVAGKYVLSDPDAAVVIWKACSALAHGEMVGLLAYLDKDVVGEAAPGVAVARVTASVPLLRAGVSAAVMTTKLAHEFYAKRSGCSG
jgi:hypothetical protein